MNYLQGDIIKIEGFNNALFLIVSKNAFIKATGVFHVCPVMKNVNEGTLHIMICGIKKTSGTVICEQLKLIDPGARACSKKDYLSYRDIMNVSDAVQCIFEYD